MTDINVITSDHYDELAVMVGELLVHQPVKSVG
jgi:hypothetical protein